MSVRPASKPQLVDLSGDEAILATSVAGGAKVGGGSVAAGADVQITPEGLLAWLVGQVHAMTAAINEARSTAIASASTCDIGAVAGNFVHITGTTTITGFGTVQAGTRRVLCFDGALVLTHNATSMILPTGANITTAAGDTAIMVSEGSGNWRCVGYQRASGRALVGSSAPKITSTITSNTITPDADTDLVRPAALAAGTTIANPSGTPADGAGFVVDLIDNGTSRALTWGSKYASRMATLPTATTAGKRHRIGFEYNAADDKLYCMYAAVAP